jgi:hypothetical protein
MNSSFLYMFFRQEAFHPSDNYIEINLHVAITKLRFFFTPPLTIGTQMNDNDTSSKKEHNAYTWWSTYHDNGGS